MIVNKSIKILIIFIFFLSIFFALKVFRKSLSINNLKASITLNDYFSLNNGYVHFVGDSIYLSKNAKNKKDFYLKNMFNDKEFKINANDKMLDLKNYNFVGLNKIENTDTIVIKQDGVFIISLGDKPDDFKDILIVKNRNRTKSKIKVVLSDYNWIAYNSFGGRSNYTDKITPLFRKILDKTLDLDNREKYVLSKNRPNLINNAELINFVKNDYSVKQGKNYHCIVSELPLILEIYKSGYDFEIIDCKKFGEFKLFGNEKLFIFNGHSEYWSESMIGRLNYIKDNSNILFFSGNNIYRKVIENDQNQLYVIENKIDSKISKIIGTYYHDSYNTGLQYDKSSSFEIDTSHYLFDEIDTVHIGGNYVVSHETDIITEYSPSDIEVIAYGKDIKCDMVLINNLNGHKLLNTSSIGSFHGLNDNNFKKFILNFIDLSLQEK
jgi:hypothetical protein